MRGNSPLRAGGLIMIVGVCCGLVAMSGSLGVGHARSEGEGELLQLANVAEHRLLSRRAVRPRRLPLLRGARHRA